MAKTVEEKPLYQRLPLKRRLFVDYYLGQANGCKSKAARLAGYQNPAQEGYRVANDPDVRAVIDERLAANAMTANEVLARLADHAKATVDDFIDVFPVSDEKPASSYREGDRCPKCEAERPESATTLHSGTVTDLKTGKERAALLCALCGDRWQPEEQLPWRLNLAKAEELGKLHLLVELGWTETGPKFKLVDQQAALVQLGRYYGLFTDKTEGRLKVENPLQAMSDEELIEYARAQRQAAGIDRGGESA